MSIEDRFRGEERRAEVFRKGLVTAIDQASTPWLATINGRRMPFIDENITVGDVVYYVDQADPFAWARTVTGGPIWLCTSLREGDTTWTSLGGDTRTLDPVPAATTADGGLVLRANTLGDTQIYDPLNEDDLAAGLLDMEVTLSTWWTYPAGFDSYSFASFNDWNSTAGIIHPGYWDGTGSDPQYWGGTDFWDPTTIDSNPTAVGLTGFRKGKIRLTYNSSTGAAQLFLALPGEDWVSQGTATFEVQTSGSGFLTRFAENGAYNSPAWWTRPVIHAFKITHQGSTLTEVTQADFDAEFRAHEPDIDPATDMPISNGYIIEAGGVNTRWSVSPYGAPIFLREREGTIDPLNTYTPTVFTDGADLSSPAIAYANLATPSEIKISNTQPTVFTSDTDAFYVYAVADLDGFTDLTDGWPTGYWPFGSTIA